MPHALCSGARDSGRGAPTSSAAIVMRPKLRSAASDSGRGAPKSGAALPVAAAC
jgi:hypothetical protein